MMEEAVAEDLNGAYWPVKTDPSKMDEWLAGSMERRDWKSAASALAGGADPNRPLAKASWDKKSGRASWDELIKGFDASRKVSSNALAMTMEQVAVKSKKDFEDMMELLEAYAKAGVDFSAPRFPGFSVGGAGAGDAALSLYYAGGPKALAIYHARKGDVSGVFADSQRCGLASEPNANEPTNAQLEELWECCGWKEVASARNEKSSKLMTLMMGKGWAGAARWMAGKGFVPDSIPTTHGLDRKVFVATPLGWIAGKAVKSEKNPEGAVDGKKAIECLKIAMEFGGKVDGGEPGSTPLELAFELAEVSSRAVASKFIEALAARADSAVLAGLGKRAAAAALRNKGSEVWGLKLASKIGCSLAGIDGDDLARALEWPVSRSKQQARFAGVMEYLRSQGKNPELFEPGHERFKVGRRICSARANRCLDALMPEGDVSKSAAGKLALATMDGSDRNRARKGSENRLACLEWLAARAGGFEWADAAGESPWARAAKLCLDRELSVFAKAGVDWKASGSALAQHALFASKAYANGARQKACLAVLDSAGVDWSALDAQGRSTFELAAATALDADELVWLAKKQIAAGGRMGTAEVKAVSRRGDEMSSLIEALAMETVAVRVPRSSTGGARL